MESGCTAGPESPQKKILVGGVPTEDAATLNSSFLEFLTDELVFGSEALDSATLEAVCQVASTQQQAACGGAKANKLEVLGAAHQSGAGPSGAPMKRNLEDQNLSDSEDEDEGGKGEKTAGKRTKGEMSAAATKKACREKARREKLNERFLDLARLVDPGSEPKTDKNTILTDAIKYVQQITVENHQLRQLNKFLEERVSALERERGQQLYQQSLMMSALGQGQMLAGGQPILVGTTPGMMSSAALPGAAMSHPQLAMPVAAMPSGSNPLLAAAASIPSAAPTPPLPTIQAAGVQQQQPPQQQAAAAGGLLTHAAPPGLMGQQAAAMMAAGSGSVMAQAPGGMMAQLGVPAGAQPSMASVGAAAAAAGVTFNMGAAVGHHVGSGSAGAGPSKPMMVNAVPHVMPYPGMYWLPPQMLDSTQDSLLRPPAA